MDITNLTCASCGAPLPSPGDANQITCPFCSTTTVIKREQAKGTLGEDASPLPADDALVSDRDWKLALAFCAVAGWTGVHRFYTGHMVLGIAMFATSGGLGLWWLIDLILILTGQFKDSKGRYLRDPNLVVGSGCLWAVLSFLALFIVGAVIAQLFENIEIGVLVAFLIAFLGAVGAFAIGYRRKTESDSSPTT